MKNTSPIYCFLIKLPNIPHMYHIWCIQENGIHIYNKQRTDYEDDCFSVLRRARDKSHLTFLEAIYISMNRPSLCRQLNNHSINIFEELLDTVVT